MCMSAMRSRQGEWLLLMIHVYTIFKIHLHLQKYDRCSFVEQT